MRCKNCGWENRPDATVCEKCNTPFSLSGIPFSNSECPYKSVPTYREPAEPTLKGTIPDGGFEQKYNSQHSGNVNSCPQCGYSLVIGATSCPNCSWKTTSSGGGFDENSVLKKTVREDGVCGIGQNRQQERRDFEVQKIKCPSCGDTVSASGKSCPNCGSDLYTKSSGGNSLLNKERRSYQGKRPGTVNPWAKQVIDHFALTPVTINEEGFSFEDTMLNYKGSFVILNRDNTDPDNPSITSKEHALLTKENGDWYIENRSEMCTTMLLIKDKRKLEVGDIIVLGNGLFRFNGER